MAFFMASAATGSQAKGFYDAPKEEEEEGLSGGRL